MSRYILSIAYIHLMSSGDAFLCHYDLSMDVIFDILTKLALREGPFENKIYLLFTSI